jgi:phage replication initiation protein
MELCDFFNGFKISVDWLEFTLNINNVVSACSYVGLDFIDFDVMEYGSMGYSKYAKHRLCSIYVYYCGNDDMGVHFRITGTSIAIFFKMFIASRSEATPFGDIAIQVDDFTSEFFALLFEVVSKKGKFSRLDLALDDFTGSFFSVDDILFRLNNCLCVSKFKNFRSICERKISDCAAIGNTLYFGSRMSDIMLRIYDKKLEQKSDVSFWTRWEFELKGERASFVANYIIQRNCIGSIFAEILNTYIRFINNDRSERKKCSVEKKWLDFVGTLSLINLSLSKNIKTIKSKQEWIEKQCFPTLAGLIRYYDGDMSFLYDKVEGSYLRNNAKNKLLFERSVDYVIQ